MSRTALRGDHGRANAAAEPQKLGEATLSRRLEQLDRIAVRVLDLDLPACRAHFHRIPEMQPVLLEGIDASGKIGHSKDDPIPATRLLLTPVGQRAGP